jgi:hypothetical protein
VTHLNLVRPAALEAQLSSYSWNATPLFPIDEPVHVATVVYNFCEVVGLVGLSADHTMIAYMCFIIPEAPLIVLSTGGFHTNPNDCKESF